MIEIGTRWATLRAGKTPMGDIHVGVNFGPVRTRRGYRFARVTTPPYVVVTAASLLRGRA